MMMARMAALTAMVATTVAAQSIDQSPNAARAVVQRYYGAIDRGDYRTAYRLWNGGKDYPAFVEGFARTAHTRVFAGVPTEPEGAVGSTFITVPVRVEAALKNGTRQHFTGSYVLRHLNDPDGATPDQLRWFIQSATLHVAR